MKMQRYEQSPKAKLRRQMRQRVREVYAEEREEGRVRLTQVLEGWEKLMGLRALLAYYPHGKELDCSLFLQVWLDSEHDLFLPKVADDAETLLVCHVPHLKAVKPGYRDILEPDMDYCRVAEAAAVEAVLVPGLAFDRSGARLGQGGGHYDRFLSTLPENCLRIGICYDFQVLETVASIPREQHDELVDYVCTPTDILDCHPPERATSL